MTHRSSLRVSAILSMLAGSSLVAYAAEPTYQRSVTFKVTFRQSDLVWVGSPESPAARAHLRPGAQAIATDASIKTVKTHSVLGRLRQRMTESRIEENNGTRTVYAFTPEREKVIGTIDPQGRFEPSNLYNDARRLVASWPADPSSLRYDGAENVLFYDLGQEGPEVRESLDFLPWAIEDGRGQPAKGTYSFRYEPVSLPIAEKVAPGLVQLVLSRSGKGIVIAQAMLPIPLVRDARPIGSFDNQAGTYLPDSAYQSGSGRPDASVTFCIPGEWTSAIRADGEKLILNAELPIAGDSDPGPAPIVIDGKFDDWRNVDGVDDRCGDGVPYLEYIPDVDLLEFKISNDNENIYFYARVAGQVGRSHPDGGRSYFYAYMDVDQNSKTGFLPTRDDDCYYGVTIGDDCEVQFEFVNNALRKTFYGFCGLGGDQDVLKQKVTLGPSQYGRLDENGKERDHYKSEYIYRDGATEITEDLKLGTSDSIRVAVSPDGSEVEIVSSLAGFLKSPAGQPTVAIGQTIDVAAGMECDSKVYPGKTRWAADSTPPIVGYKLRPVPVGAPRSAGKSK